MGHVRILFSLLFLVGCVRPEWSAPLITTAPPSSSTNGEMEEIIEAHEYDITDGDDYELAIESLATRSLRVTFYASAEDVFYMPCEWQGRVCHGLLPLSARESRFLVLRDKNGECPRFRLFREREELEIAEPFRLGGCGFVLAEPLETPP